MIEPARLSSYFFSFYSDVIHRGYGQPGLSLRRDRYWTPYPLYCRRYRSTPQSTMFITVRSYLTWTLPFCNTLNSFWLKGKDCPLSQTTCRVVVLWNKLAVVLGCVFFGVAFFILNIFDSTQGPGVAGGAKRNLQHLGSTRFVFSFNVQGGCGGKVGLLGGSSCTHTKSAFEQSSFISSSINASQRPLFS